MSIAMACKRDRELGYRWESKSNVQRMFCVHGVAIIWLQKLMKPSRQCRCFTWIASSYSWVGAPHHTFTYKKTLSIYNHKSRQWIRRLRNRILVDHYENLTTFSSCQFRLGTFRYSRPKCFYFVKDPQLQAHRYTILLHVNFSCHPVIVIGTVKLDSGIEDGYHNKRQWRTYKTMQRTHTVHHMPFVDNNILYYKVINLVSLECVRHFDRDPHSENFLTISLNTTVGVDQSGPVCASSAWAHTPLSVLLYLIWRKGNEEMNRRKPTKIRAHWVDFVRRFGRR